MGFTDGCTCDEGQGDYMSYYIEHSPYPRLSFIDERADSDTRMYDLCTSSVRVRGHKLLSQCSHLRFVEKRLFVAVPTEIALPLRRSR